jgi:hypothetical protein
LGQRHSIRDLARWNGIKNPDVIQVAFNACGSRA